MGPYYLRQVAEAASALGILVNRFQLVQCHLWSRVVLALFGGVTGARRM